MTVDTFREDTRVGLTGAVTSDFALVAFAGATFLGGMLINATSLVLSCCLFWLKRTKSA